MRRLATLSASLRPLRQVPAALPPRRAFPAWIDAAGDSLGGVLASRAAPAATPSPVAVTPRVRASLVLRLVVKRQPSRLRHPSDAPVHS